MKKIILILLICCVGPIFGQKNTLVPIEQYVRDIDRHDSVIDRLNKEIKRCHTQLELKQIEITYQRDLLIASQNRQRKLKYSLIGALVLIIGFALFRKFKK